MVPGEYLVPYLLSNACGVLVLLQAFRRPTSVVWVWAGVFLWAAAVNTMMALREPWAYLAYGGLTPLEWYRGFIDGWFSRHIREMVLSIAAGQLVIALLLARSGAARRLGLLGAVVFLIAIAPLGVGAAFPFPLIGAVSLVVSDRRLTAFRRHAPSPGSRFVPVADVRHDQVVDLRAPASLVFDVARHVDLFGDPLVVAVLRFRRYVMGGEVRPRKATGLVAETLALGWGVLHYAAGRTLVIGAVSRPWAPDVTFSAVEPTEFADFADPDLVKIVWTLEAEPLDPVRTRFRSEMRVQATDPDAQRRFRRYWLHAGLGIHFIRWRMLAGLRREAERRHRVSARAVGHAA